MTLVMDERYQIHEKIGQGGLGAVYRATDMQLRREVAIKRLLPPDASESAKTYGGASPANLIAEATTLSALQHPNIVTVYDIGVDAKGAFVVMELLKGETFDSTVERGALTEKDFQTFVLQTMEALVAAHHAGIIHRDLKPSNLMVNWLPSGKFQIKVLDFGLAKFSRKPSIQTTDHGDGVLGSIYFMAPEQFERGALDARTDLYSMGALYHYCLTGKYPFDGNNAPQVMAAHLQSQVKPIGQLRPDLSGWMCEWVMWLINRKAENRPQSAQQALDLFQKQLQADGAKSEQAKALTAQNLAVPLKAAAPASVSVPGTQSEAPIMNPEIPPVSEDVLDEEGVNAEKRLPVPLWAIIVIPICVIFLVMLILEKSGKKKIINDRNQMIIALNEAERPEGNATIVNEFIVFMRLQPQTENGKNNVLGAITTLSRLEGEGVDQEIVNQLTQLPKAQTFIRRGLIGVIVDRRYTDGLPVLVSQIGDKDSKVNRGAIYAVGELGSEGNLGKLISELENSTGKNADALEDAIVRISLKNPDTETRNELVRSVLREEAPIEEYRERLLRILGYLGGTKVWADLKRILNGNDQEARKAVLQSLGSWPDGQPLDTLYELIQNEENNVIRVMALRAYIPLLSAPSYTSDEKKAQKIMEIFEVAGSRNNKHNLIGVLAGLATDEAQSFIESLASKDQSFASPSDLASKQIALNISKLVAVNKEGIVLTAASAMAFGEGGFEYDATDGAVIGWTNPQFHLVWPINFGESGSFEIAVNSATPPGGGGQFEVVLAGGRGTARTVSSEQFEDIPVGSFEIKEPGTYRLTVMGLSIDQDQQQLMQLRSVSLKRN